MINTKQSEQPKPSEQPEKIYIVFDKSENVWDSYVKDFFSFLFICLLILVSKDSRWWTFATGIIFVLFWYGQLRKIADERTHRFAGLPALKRWVLSLEEKEEKQVECNYFD